MKIEEVRKLSPLDIFVYWVNERHKVYNRRKNGKPKPWTDDEILQTQFFTNPYRENDKTTVWFRENVREPLRNDRDVLFATIIFRWFNYISTGEVLRAAGLKHGLLTLWDAKLAQRILGKMRDNGCQIFTGAFMINSPGGEKKLEAIIRRITNVWRDRENLYNWIDQQGDAPISMESFHKCLSRYEGLGGFMAYEIVCDLRYTYLLENAPDKETWCNIGPGARRGLYRILNVPFEKGNNTSSPSPLPNEMEEIVRLLGVVRKRLPKLPFFELREIEHSLCETDKYMRVLHGDGRSKRKYDGK